MNEQLPKDPVTLDQLKLALGAVQVARDRYEESNSIQTNLWATVAEREAWHTAFEWREGLIHRHMTIFHADALKAWISERDEGIALIREKLQS
jgi:hypothetical protein